MHPDLSLPDLTPSEYAAALTDNGLSKLPIDGLIALPNGTCVQEAEGGATRRERLAFLLEIKQRNLRRTPEQVWHGTIPAVAAKPLLPGSLTTRAILALIPPPSAAPSPLIAMPAMVVDGLVVSDEDLGPKTVDQTGRELFNTAKAAQDAFWDALGALERHLDIEIDGRDALAATSYDALLDEGKCERCRDAK